MPVEFEIIHESYFAICTVCPDWFVKGFTGNSDKLLAWEAEMAAREHVRQTCHEIDGIHRREVKWVMENTQSEKSTPSSVPSLKLIPTTSTL